MITIINTLCIINLNKNNYELLNPFGGLHSSIFYLDLVLISANSSLSSFHSSMKHFFVKSAVLLMAVLTLSQCGQQTGDSSQQSVENGNLVIYSGRSKALVEPLVTLFTKSTGIQVDVKYGGTSQLAIALMEEGDKSPADLFWAQDAGALGALGSNGLLLPVPSDIMDLLDRSFVNETGTWIATSGRGRVLAYSSTRVNQRDLPQSVFELTDSKFKGRVAWAPSNGSFQAFVTAMTEMHGIDRTREWLVAMKRNGAVAYTNNNAILQGIAAGEADLGITNHYYLLRSKAEDPNFPVEQTHFADGDVGNMLNVAGVGLLKSGKNQTAAERFLTFILSRDAQMYIATDVFEYPVVDIEQGSGSIEPARRVAPSINVEKIADLEATIVLLREAGLL
jgi:iron(III) transport system substrate-binding protein